MRWHWQRLLFTRFLAENHLLITDAANGSVPVTLEDCEELASELGAKDGLELACRFSSTTLPGVFRTEMPWGNNRSMTPQTPDLLRSDVWVLTVWLLSVTFCPWPLRR
jgi:hypothetical protein